MMAALPRRRRPKLALHEALAEFVPTFQEFLQGGLNGEDLWHSYHAYFGQHDEDWDKPTWRVLEELLVTIDGCVPDGITPNPKNHEVDETELRKKIADLLVEAGHDVEGIERARQGVPIRSADARRIALADALGPVANLLRACVADEITVARFTAEFEQALEGMGEMSDWYVRTMLWSFFLTVDAASPPESRRLVAILLDEAGLQ